MNGINSTVKMEYARKLWKQHTKNFKDESAVNDF